MLEPNFKKADGLGIRLITVNELGTFILVDKTSPIGFSASKCDVG